jgi:hypothetical protein
MIERMFGLVEPVRAVVRDLDPASLTGDQVREALDEFGELERLAAAGRALLAARATETNLWRAGGDRSPEHWLARRSGTTVGAAKDTLDTVAKLRELPATETSLRNGELSLTQTSLVASAAVADPSAESALLDTARAASVGELRRRSESVRAAARSAEDEAAEADRIRRTRSVWRSTGPDGSDELHARGPTADIARLWARLQPFVDDQFELARKQGREEPLAAYAFDALLAMSETAATGGGRGAKPKSPAKVIVRVDLPAVRRGSTEPGEICEIDGYGPIPVSEALRLMPEAFLLLTRGHDVVNVTHLGRQFTAHQQTALEWRDPECVTLGCHNTVRLERDHRDDWAHTHQTTITSADRLCHTHHRLKTAGWRLAPGEGKRALLPP